MYFLVSGYAGFVIPECDDLCFIVIESGDHFGVMDLVPDRKAMNSLNNIGGGGYVYGLR